METVSPYSETKEGAHSSFDCHPVPQSACLRLGRSSLGTPGRVGLY